MKNLLAILLTPRQYQNRTRFGQGKVHWKKSSEQDSVTTKFSYISFRKQFKHFKPSSQPPNPPPKHDMFEFFFIFFLQCTIEERDLFSPFTYSLVLFHPASTIRPDLTFQKSRNNLENLKVKTSTCSAAWAAIIYHTLLFRWQPCNLVNM